MIAFTNHCAVFIQKYIRKFLTRKNYLRMLRDKAKIAALVCGYKTRRLITVSGLKGVISNCVSKSERSFYVQ